MKYTLDHQHFHHKNSDTPGNRDLLDFAGRIDAFPSLLFAMQAALGIRSSRGHETKIPEAQVSSGLKKAGILEFRYSFDRPAEPQGWPRSLP